MPFRLLTKKKKKKKKIIYISVLCIIKRME